VVFCIAVHRRRLVYSIWESTPDGGGPTSCEESADPMGGPARGKVLAPRLYAQGLTVLPPAPSATIG